MELVYPISLDYVPHWGEWQVIRELVQNAMDVDLHFRMGKEGDTFFVEDRGPGTQIRHLILGVSDKGEEARGKWGEGLKLALLVLTRMGLTAHISTGGLRLHNEPETLMADRVFKVVWEEANTYVEGTRIEIPGWEGDIFEDRFLRPGDPRIVYTDQWGRCILKETKPSFYHKGIYLSRARSYSIDYAFGYNLITTPVDRDRGVVESCQANSEVGKVWQSVDDIALLEQFYKAVDDKMGEKDVWMTSTPHPKAHKKAIQAIYGKHVVVSTSKDLSREAEHIGATSVDIPTGIKAVMEEAVGTDRDYVLEMQGKSMVSVPDKDLPEPARHTLTGLRKLAKRIKEGLRVDAYVLDGAKANTSGDTIRLDLSTMTSQEEALASLIHELAHQEYGAADCTEEMVAGACKIGARLLRDYVWRK